MGNKFFFSFLFAYKPKQIFKIVLTMLILEIIFEFQSFKTKQNKNPRETFLIFLFMQS